MKSLHERVYEPIRAMASVALTSTMILALAVFIAGCGGSGGSEPSTQALVRISPPIAISKAGGVWIGSLTNDLTGQTFAISGVVTEDNLEGRFVTDGVHMFLLHDIVASGGEVSATISALARPESVFLDGSFEASGILTGSLVERTRIEGEWSLDTGDAGTLTLGYDDLYERGSDIARLVGIWEGSFGTVYSIDALGEIFGQTEQGCIYNGQVQLIDATCNVYRVDLNGGCLAFMSSGLGVLTDDSGTNDAFFIMLDLGISWFIADTLLRQ